MGWRMWTGVITCVAPALKSAAARKSQTWPASSRTLKKSTCFREGAATCHSTPRKSWDGDEVHRVAVAIAQLQHGHELGATQSARAEGRRRERHDNWLLSGL